MERGKREREREREGGREGTGGQRGGGGRGGEGGKKRERREREREDSTIMTYLAHSGRHKQEDSLFEEMLQVSQAIVSSLQHHMHVHPPSHQCT